jgi:hypothetical protein
MESVTPAVTDRTRRAVLLAEEEADHLEVVEAVAEADAAEGQTATAWTRTLATIETGRRNS